MDKGSRDSAHESGLASQEALRNQPTEHIQEHGDQEDSSLAAEEAAFANATPRPMNYEAIPNDHLTELTNQMHISPAEPPVVPGFSYPESRDYANYSDSLEDERAGPLQLHEQQQQQPQHYTHSQRPYGEQVVSSTNFSRREGHGQPSSVHMYQGYQGHQGYLGYQGYQGYPSFSAPGGSGSSSRSYTGHRHRGHPATDLSRNGFFSPVTPNYTGHNTTQFDQHTNWSNLYEYRQSNNPQAVSNRNSQLRAFPSTVAEPELDELAEQEQSTRTTRPDPIGDAYAQPTASTATWPTANTGSTQSFTSPGSEYQPGAYSNPGYEIHPSAEFWPGQVFMIDWAEPRGVQHATTVLSRTGSTVFRKHRRFIVAVTFEGHSTCLPILTYGGQACKKRGVRSRHHGIVHSQNSEPRQLSGEPKLGFAPIMMESINDTERLRIESRVNYAKSYTVEHNTLVRFVGRIVEGHIETMLSAIDELKQEYTRSYDRWQ